MFLHSGCAVKIVLRCKTALFIPENLTYEHVPHRWLDFRRRLPILGRPLCDTTRHSRVLRVPMEIGEQALGAARQVAGDVTAAPNLAGLPRPFVSCLFFVI